MIGGVVVSGTPFYKGMFISQAVQISQRDRATRYVSWNLVNCCTTVQQSCLGRLAIGECVENGAIR